MLKRITVGLCVLVLGGVAVAQVPQMPTPEEIEARIEKEMDKLPTIKVEDDVLEISYKQVPSDPKEIVKKAAGGQLPPGMDPEQAIKMYMPLARPYIAKAFGTIGKLKVKQDVKINSKKLPAGDYVFGLIMEGEYPVGVLISSETLRKPLKLPLKRAKAKTPFENLDVKVVIKGKSKPYRVFEVGFGPIQGQAGKVTAKAKSTS